MDEELPVYVGPMQCEPTRCHLELLRPDHARIRVPAAASRCDPASPSALWLGGVRDAVIVPAVAGWPEEDGDDHLVELFFSDPDALAQIDPLHPRLDRRSAIRVSPDIGEVEVLVQTDGLGEGLPIPVGAVDLSAGGMCVEMPQEWLHGRDVLTFQIMLPGALFPLVLAAKLRYRVQAAPGMSRIGVEFDREHSVDFDAQASCVARWVAVKRDALVQRIMALAR